MAERLDIVHLVKNSDINQIQQTKLIEKIKDNFSENDQQLFVASFYCYLNYEPKAFVIDLENVWRWCGFSRKDPAKIVIKKNFKENIDYIVKKNEVKAAPEVGGAGLYKNLGGAGLNKEKLLMNIKTFKKFCLKAGTKKADEIHDYYIKLEELLQETLKEQADEMKLQLLDKEKQILQKDTELLQKNTELLQKDTDHIIDKKTDTHNLLVNKFNYRRCVYLGEIIYDNKTFIKIGSTEDVANRFKIHKKTYGNFVYLDVFECTDFRNIEVNILRDNYIKQNLYREEINAHISHECVLMSDMFNYAQLINIVKNYVKNIYVFTPEQLIEKQRLDLEKAKVESDLLLRLMDDPDLKDVVKERFKLYNFTPITQIQTTVQKIQIPLEKNETNIPNHMNLVTKPFKRAPKGRKVQKIDPNNFSIFTVYDSMVYVLRAPENIGYQKSSIQTAIKNNRIYKGWRWNFVENDADSNIVNIQETNPYKNKPPIINTIIQLNSNKTEIINTFHTKDTLLKQLKIAKITLIRIIQNEELYNNSYYIEQYKCPPHLLENYDRKINRIVYTKSKQISQYNPTTKHTVIFNSFTEIYIKLGISSKTIIKAIEQNMLFCGCTWSYV